MAKVSEAVTSKLPLSVAPSEYRPRTLAVDEVAVLKLLNFMSEYASIIVTSREFIEVDGEIPYTLRQMTLDEAYELYTNDLGERKISKNEKTLMPCSVLLQTEYYGENVCVGVPIILGKKGMEEIIIVELNEVEKQSLATAISHNHELIESMK